MAEGRWRICVRRIMRLWWRFFVMNCALRIWLKTWRMRSLRKCCLVGPFAWRRRSGGRFRSYLLGAVKNFLSHQRVAEQRWKRGGKVMHVSLDDEEAAQVADAGNLSPDAAYDRQWALTLLGHAMDALRAECKKQGREEFFELVQPWLTGSASHGDQVSLAERCGMTPAAFKMAIQRMKHRFRQCVKEQVAGTLTDPSDLAQEMESLFAALGG